MLLTAITVTISFITLLLGILFILSPGGLVKIEEIANNIVLRDIFFLKHPKLTGLSLILAGCWMLWVYFFH